MLPSTRECGCRSASIDVLLSAVPSRGGSAKRWRFCQKESARIGRRNEGNRRKEILGLENRNTPGFEELRRAELGGILRRLPSERQTKSKNHPDPLPQVLHIELQ